MFIFFGPITGELARAQAGDKVEALEKEVGELNATNTDQRAEIDRLTAILNAIQSQNAILHATNLDQRAEIDRLQAPKLVQTEEAAPQATSKSHPSGSDSDSDSKSSNKSSSSSSNNKRRKRKKIEATKLSAEMDLKERELAADVEQRELTLRC